MPNIMLEKCSTLKRKQMYLLNISMTQPSLVQFATPLSKSPTFFFQSFILNVSFFGYYQDFDQSRKLKNRRQTAVNFKTPI